MSDRTLENGSQIIDALTPIAGPSHEDLRRPFQKTVGQHARDFRQQNELAVIEVKEQQQKLHGGK
jgi:hypothetical protein